MVIMIFRPLSIRFGVTPIDQTPTLKRLDYFMNRTSALILSQEYHR